ncbi:MAG: DUF5615 family PIN-like protein [Egibacteraceae bacterium]
MGGGSCTGAGAAVRGLGSRLLVDANLSPRVAARLCAAGHDAVHVADCGLLRASDDRILAAAAEDDRTIVSADADFGVLLALGGHERPSVVLLHSTICAVRPPREWGRQRQQDQPVGGDGVAQHPPVRAEVVEGTRDGSGCLSITLRRASAVCSAPVRQTDLRSMSAIHPGTRYHLDMI